MSARTEPRFTRDVDIAVAVGGDSDAEALVRTLRTTGYQLDTLVNRAPRAGLRLRG